MKINKLKINKKNPRKISPEKIEKLKQSIEDFPKMMELRPIVYDPATMEILGGNMRFLVLKKLGYKEIPDQWIRSADELTDEEKQRFIIEDNVQFGEWDFEMLSNEFEIEDLQDWGMEIEYPEEKTNPEEIELKPYKKTHILLSFPPEKILELKEYLDKILEFDFIEYEQSSN